MDPATAFDPVYQQFAFAAAGWYAVLFDYANQLFLMLATIEIGLGAIQWMVAQQSHDYIAMGLFRKILWIGFMYAILLYSHDWIPAILSSFTQAGIQAAGIQGLNPGEIFVEGLALTGSLLGTFVDLVYFWKAPTIIACMFAGMVVFFSFCAISIQMALTLMESYIVTGGGVFLLGFGAFHGTVHVTERYLSYMIGVGIKLFTISLIVGAGAQLTDQWIAMIHDPNLMSVVAGPLSIAGGALLYGVAAWLIPSLAASFASGVVGFGLQEAIGATVTASRVATSTLMAPMALGAGASAAVGIARQSARNSGGGIGGNVRGLGSGLGAVSREARNFAVPTLSRGVQNLQKQRNDMQEEQ